MMIELADIWVNQRILEPSAWNGNILKNIPYNNHVTAVELNPEFYDTLVDIMSDIDQEWSVIIGDFLSLSNDVNTWDRIIMNPPFSKGQDVNHILHAYDLLAKDWILVAVASVWAVNRTWPLYEELRSLRPEIYELPEGSFKTSWTMVNTVIIKIKK